MNKNTIIGIVLIAAILFGFSWYTSKQAQEQMALQAKQDSIHRVEQLKQMAADSAWAAEHPLTVTDSTGALATQPGTVYKDSLLEAASHGEQELVVLSNDKLELVLTTQGGQPYSARIKDYRNYDSTDLYLFRPGASHYGISLYTGETINTADFVFQLVSKTDTSVVMRLPFAGGGCIEQHAYLFAGFKRVSNNLLTIAANLRVGLAIGQGVNGADGLTAELALGNVGERNLLASRSTHSQRQRHAKRE